MIDYSESMIKLTALIMQYRKLLHKQQYSLAADCAVDMQLMTLQLQEWAESKCTETQNS